MPDLPVEDRAADTWEPLVAVADAAGGDWPMRARHAAKILSAEADKHAAESSENVQLLADIQTVFSKHKTSFMKSKVLCEYLLVDIEDSPWPDKELNPSKLGRRLSDYGTGHNTTRTERGYRLQDFLDAFERYITADKASEGVQGVQHAADLHERPDTFERPDTLKASSSEKTSSHNPRSDPLWTPSDAIGHPHAENTACRRCGEPNPDHPRLCGDCLADLHHEALKGAPR